MGLASLPAKEVILVESTHSADFSGVICFKWQDNFIKP